MVGLQSTQARLQRGDYLLAVVAGTVRITRVGLVGELGAEHEPVAAPFEQVAEDGFRSPVGVDVGGVDDIAASVSEQVQHPRADLWGCPPAPVFTKRHGAQRHLRDPHARLTQKPVTHGLRKPPRARRVVDRCCPTLARSCQRRHWWPGACLTDHVHELARLKDLILRNAREARTWTALTGVSVLRSPTTTEPMGDVTEPTVAVIAQGAKETALNGRTFAYGPGKFVIT